MLCRLEIKNIALIDEISIELSEGLNILTGETGAGKSIIIDSINMLLGERFSRDLIRTGKDKALIEAMFQVDNKRMEETYKKYGVEPEKDGSLIISREFNISGRSTCRVNGRLVTVTALKEIGGYLIDIHGQYDNQSLLRSETHIELLDLFGGEQIRILKLEYLKLFEGRKTIISDLIKLTGDERGKERRIDLLKYQINEIKSAKLKIGEEEILSKEREVYINSEKIIETLGSVYDELFTENPGGNSFYDSFVEGILKLKSISAYSEKYKTIGEKMGEVSYQLEDIREEIRRERDSIEYNPYLLEQVGERLDLIYSLKKKYGNNISEILEYCENGEEELDKIIKSEEHIRALQLQLSKIEKELFIMADKLNKERIKVARVLENGVCKELADLEMENALFNVSITKENGGNNSPKFKANGTDIVEFLISPNIGEPLKPLTKIASGGEMARIMLAIKSNLANVDKIPTLIFDEIDIGISGKGSQRVGEKLAFLSESHQVICVTHQAQIACMAKNHYLIEKISGEDTTRTKVTKLSYEKTLEEIARILGGDAITDKTKGLAREMLINARKHF